MKFNYKRTFDAVRLAPNQQERIRSVLSSRTSEALKEDANMNIKLHKKPRKMLIISIATLVLMLLAGFGYAYRNEIIQLLGGTIEYGMNSEGETYVAMGISSDFTPAEVRNGEIYFVLDGSDKNITSYCSETTYYQYEEINEDGYREVIVVGGTPDNLGWGTFIFDETGFLSGSSAMYQPDETEAKDNIEPMWLQNARKDLCE